MPINTALIAELKHEAANTKKMLERLPEDKLTWSPHDKSMKAGKLAKHIADLPIWTERIINGDEFDFAAAKFNTQPAESVEEILNLFDERQAEAVKVLESASDDTLNSLWTAKRGEHVVFQLPKKIALRNFTYNHIYHHRGQFSVYLRLLGIPVPGMYGPSADEMNM